jgi:hypothetical protein
MEVHLDGREFKLLLDPSGFAGLPDEAMANRFLAMLKRTVDAGLARDSGGSRVEGAFKSDKVRLVQFWDRPDDPFSRHGFTIRSRIATDRDGKQGRRELSLKFRSRDLVLADAICRLLLDQADPSGVEEVETEFEEDIAPLQVTQDGGGTTRIVRATPAAMQSRFSVARKHKSKRDKPFQESRHLLELFPALRPAYAMASGGRLSEPFTLEPGPLVHERTFDGVQLHLGENAAADLTLTLWDFPEAADGALPRIVEVSYAMKLRGDADRADASRRACAIFVALQKLPVNSAFTSKTEFALPPAHEAGA